MYEGMLFEKVRKVKAKHLKDLMKIPMLWVSESAKS